MYTSVYTVHLLEYAHARTRTGACVWVFFYKDRVGGELSLMFFNRFHRVYLRKLSFTFHTFFVQLYACMSLYVYVCARTRTQRRVYAYLDTDEWRIKLRLIYFNRFYRVYSRKLSFSFQTFLIQLYACMCMCAHTHAHRGVCMCVFT